MRKCDNYNAINPTGFKNLSGLLEVEALQSVSRENWNVFLIVINSFISTLFNFLID